MLTDELLRLLRDYFEPLGLEVYLFKSQWYNEKVSNPFKLQFNDDTLCAVVLSTPLFFENSFIPFVKSSERSPYINDPIDSCIAYYVEKLKENPMLAKLSTTTMYDYEVLPNRRPKVLVQTAAHVSGAAYYYKRDSVTIVEETNSQKTNLLTENTDANQYKNPWNEQEKIFGVCIHPKFGGWFAVRAVIIFDTIVDPNLNYVPPIDCVSSRELRIKLLDSFNKNWTNWSYRDIIPVQDRYSDLQKEYFLTLPKNRTQLLSKYLQQ